MQLLSKRRSISMLIWRWRVQEGFSLELPHFSLRVRFSSYPLPLCPLTTSRSLRPPRVLIVSRLLSCTIWARFLCWTIICLFCCKQVFSESLRLKLAAKSIESLLRAADYSCYEQHRFSTTYFITMVRILNSKTPEELQRSYFQI